MRRTIAKHFGYPLQDFVSKTNILGTYNSLLKSQYWSEDQIYDYQLKRLKTIVDHAKRNVPYYEELFGKLKLSASDIKTLDDIQKIPILTKDIVREHNSSLIARNYNKKGVNIGSTGGTTGSPVTVYKDPMDRTYTWASYYRWYTWMGMHYSDKAATLWGAKTVLTDALLPKLKRQFIYYVQNEKYINWFNVNESSYKKVYDDIVDFNPFLLKGYVSAMLDFASFVEDSGLKELSPKALSTTSETLLPHNRAYLEEVFSSEIFDQYGCGEANGIAYECGKHNGLHVNQEHVIIEILDENDQRIYEKSGRIIVTNFDSFVMPFIRFENGDLSSLSLDKCACGVNQPLLKNIDGRSIDTVTLNTGSKVHGVFFTDILAELKIRTNQIQKFQIYQNTPGKIEFRYECKTPLEKSLQKLLKQKLELFCDEVIMVETDHIPKLPNGKYKYIVNDLKE